MIAVTGTYHLQLQRNGRADHNQTRVLRELCGGAERGILAYGKYHQYVHDVIACLSAASGCDGEQIDPVKTLTDTLNLTVMGFVIERGFFQDPSAEALASSRTPFENVRHDIG
jgi:hypothetical protein